MNKIKGLILGFLILWGLWIILTDVSGLELVTGAVIAWFISAIFISRLEILSSICFKPRAVINGVAFIFVFLIELFKSAIDVAGRVLSLRLPLNPGIVKVRTRLKSKLGRIVLANSITLTPGTMTVETDGEYFYIHWIDIKSPDIEETTKAIVSKFERHLEVMFG